MSLGLREWYEVINEDYPSSDLLVTGSTVSRTVERSRHVPSDVRFAMGRIWTDRSYESRRIRVLNTPLP